MVPDSHGVVPDTVHPRHHGLGAPHGVERNPEVLPCVAGVHEKDGIALGALGGDQAFESGQALETQVEVVRVEDPQAFAVGGGDEDDSRGKRKKGTARHHVPPTARRGPPAPQTNDRLHSGGAFGSTVNDANGRASRFARSTPAAMTRRGPAAR